MEVPKKLNNSTSNISWPFGERVFRWIILIVVLVIELLWLIVSAVRIVGPGRVSEKMV
jgi:hypothetical protein